MRKFARRNRWLLVPIAAIAAALLIGLAGTTAGLLRARTERDAARAAEAAEARARQAADEQRAAAKLSEAKAKEQADKLWTASLFLHRLLSPITVLSPPAPPTEVPAPAEVLDFVDKCANDGFLKGHPETEVPIRDGLGESYIQSANWPAAEREYRLALEKCLELPVAEQVNVPSYESSIGICLLNEGKYDQAEKMHRQSLAIYQQRSWQEATAIVEQYLAADLAVQGDFDGAIPFLKDARRIERQMKPSSNPDVLRVLTGLASEREKAGDPDGPAIRDIASRLRADLEGPN